MAKDIRQLANDIAAAGDADVLLINSAMDRGVETSFIDTCAAQCRRTNVIVIIVTSGGDADVSYRIARCLQQRYQRVTALISGQCKSAGTLLAIGAHELAFSDHGELGPLDVQLRKADDLWAATSGLTVMNAFTALQTKSEEAFNDFATSIKVRSGGSVTFKTAADIATKLTVGMFSHIYQQVEVMHVGEAARAMKIAEEYGQRLDRVADNLKDRHSLGRLVASYPSHGFVIDMREAEELFKRVRLLTDDEKALCEQLGHMAKLPSSRNVIGLYLSEPPPQDTSKTHTNDTEQTNRADPAGQEQGAQGVADAPAQPAQASEGSGAEVLRLPTGSQRA